MLFNSIAAVEAGYDELLEKEAAETDNRQCLCGYSIETLPSGLFYHGENRHVGDVSRCVV